METAQATNPHTGEIIGEYQYISDQELTAKVEKSLATFQTYRKTDPKERIAKFQKLVQVLNDNLQKYADVITKEQGKPIQEAINEVKKAASHTKYYAENLESFLKDEVYNTEFKKSVVEYHPVGPIFQVAPFNFPFWLVFKSVIPALAIGNTVITKTASACPETGLMLQEAFDLAGLGDGIFQYVLTKQEQSELIISHPAVKGVSFTGSTKGGAVVASLAGKYCKKTVMELGGSDPFIVLEDADVDLAVATALGSRLRNAGQVCTCAKRFIIHEKVFDEFKAKVVEKVSAMKVGNPFDKDVNIGPLTKLKVLEDIEKQVNEGVKQGAKVLVGGKRPDTEDTKKGYYYLPTVVEVTEGNILFTEETFGPVVPLLKVSNTDDILRIANDTEYGLGGIIISKDVEKAQELGKYLDVGCLFYNAPVSSDSRLPSGGVKNSGFGRECGPYGMREFANIKTVVVK